MPAASRRRPAARKKDAARPLLPWLAAIAAAALVLRLLYLVSISGSPFVQTLQTNPERYDQWATLILSGSAPLPPFEQAPGYAYVLALVYAVAGHSPGAVMVVQAVADAVGCGLIFLIALRCCGWRAAIAAGALAAFYAPLIYFTGELLPASLGLCALTAATAAAVYRRWLTCGVLCAVAFLVRNEAALAALILAPLAWPAGDRAWLKVLAPVLLTAAALSLVASAVTGTGIPLTSGDGLNLWVGNNPHADAVNPFLTAAIAPTAERIRDAAGGDVLRANRMLRQQALLFVEEFPMQAAALFWKKLRWTLSGRELPNTSDIEWQESYSWLLNLPAVPLRFAPIFVLAGAALPFLRRLKRDALPLLAPLAVALVTCTVFFTNARFRLPLLPPLFVLGGHAVDQLWTLLPRWRRNLRLLAAALCTALLATWISSSNPYDVWTYRIAQLDVNTGIAEREAGHLAAAVQYLRRGLAATPDDSIAWIHLALALEQDGDRAAAAEAYLNGLSRCTERDQLAEMTRRFFVRQRLALPQLDEFLQTPSANVRSAIIREVRERLR